MKKEPIYKNKINKTEKLLRELDFIDAMGLCSFILCEGIRLLREENENGEWKLFKETLIVSLDKA